MAGSVEQIFIVPRSGETPIARGFGAWPTPAAASKATATLSPPDRWIPTGCAITLIEAEVIEAVLDEHGIDIAEGRSRRQVVTRGVG